MCQTSPFLAVGVGEDVQNLALQILHLLHVCCFPQFHFQEVSSAKLALQVLDSPYTPTNYRQKTHVLNNSLTSNRPFLLLRINFIPNLRYKIYLYFQRNISQVAAACPPAPGGIWWYLSCPDTRMATRSQTASASSM